MFQPSFQDPQIEVIFNGRRHDGLLSALAAAGFRPVIASVPIETRTSVPLLIDLSDATSIRLGEFGLSSGDEIDRPLILFGKLPGKVRVPGAWIHISSTDLIATLPARLDLRRRSLLRENERQLRQLSERSFGSPLYFETHEHKPSTHKVLFVGPVGARFLPLSKGLAERGVQVFAAMTMQTAKMHLDADTFRLLLIDPSRSPEEVANLVRGRGDMPVYVLGSRGGDVFDGCINMDGDSDTAYDFIAHRARSIPLRTRLDRVRLGATSHDPLTGLYSEAFLRAHLPRQMEACAQFETPLTLLHLRCRDSTLGSGELVTLSRAIVANLRETDLLVLLDQSSFLASLRDTSYAGAAQLAGRIISVIADLPGIDRTLSGRFLWRAVERRGCFTPEGLIKAAQNGPYSRTIAA